MTLVSIEDTEVIGEAHWNVFLPTAAFALLFVGLWAVLDILDRGTTMPARFAFLVAVLATPLLALLAFLRYQTTRISRSFDGLWIEVGWPSMTPRHVGFDDIADVDVNSPPISGRFGAGDLTLLLHSGEAVKVRSLAAVDEVAGRIRPAAGATPEHAQ